MPTERIIIVVEERGTRRVKQEIREVGTTAKASAGSVGLLQKALLGFAGVAAIRKTVGVLASFEQQLATVRGITGATEQQFAALRDTAADLGATTRFSATEAAEGLVFLARAGFSVDEQLESLDDTLRLAQAGALGLGRAADISSNVLRGFRLEATEAGRAVDVLAFAANNSNTNVEQLGDALKFVAPVASGLGVSLEEATAAVGTLSDAGLQASLAGTGLRRVLSELESPAGKTIGILADLGLTADDVRVSQVGLTSALRRLAEAGIDTGQALEIFGDRGGPAFEVLASGIPQVQRLTEELGNAAGTAAELARVQDDNLLGALLAVRSALEAVILSIGDAGVTSVLEESLRSLADALRFVAANADVALASLTAFGVSAAAVRLGPLAIQGFEAARAFLVLRSQVAAGTVVLLGSAEADRQRALASVQAAAADLQKTQAALANLKAESARALAVRNSSTALFAQAAVTKQVAILEAQATAQTTALTAAQGGLAASTAAANAQATLLGRTLVRLRAIIKTVTLAIAANPIGAIAVGVSAAVVALIAFQDRIRISSDSAATLGDLFRATFQIIGEAISAAASFLRNSFASAIEFVSDNFGFIGDTVDRVFGDVEFSIEGAARVVARIIDNQIGLFLGLFNVINFGVGEVRDAFGSQIEAISTIVTQVINVIIRNVRSAVQGVIGFVNLLIDSANRAITALGGERIENVILGGLNDINLDGFTAGAGEKFFIAGQAVVAKFNEGADFSGAEGLLDNVIARAEQINRDRTAPVAPSGAAPGAPDLGGVGGAGSGLFGDDAVAEFGRRQEAIQSINADLANQAALLGQTNREREISTGLQQIEQTLAEKNVVLTESERDLTEARLRNLQALSDQAAVLQEIRGPQEDLAARQDAVNALFESGQISADQYAEELRKIAAAANDTDQTLSGGFSRGLEAVGDQLRNFSDQAEATIVNAFGSAEDAIVQFRKTGEFEFGALVDSVLDDLTRLLARKALFALVDAFSGTPGGSETAANFIGPVQRQIGGPLGAGQSAVVGENGPELFTPRVPGNITPSGQTQTAMSRPAVNVTVVNQISDDFILDAVASERGDEVIFNKIERNPRRVNALTGR